VLDNTHTPARVFMNQLDQLSIVATNLVNLTHFFQALQTNCMTTLSLRIPCNAQTSQFQLPWKTLKDIHIYNELGYIDDLRLRASEARVKIHCHY